MAQSIFGDAIERAAAVGVDDDRGESGRGGRRRGPMSMRSMVCDMSVMSAVRVMMDVPGVAGFGGAGGKSNNRRRNQRSGCKTDSTAELRIA